MFFLVLIFFYFLSFESFTIFINSNYYFLEFICSLIPFFILLLEVLPSLSVLFYYNYMIINSDFNLKILGHQWYWTYEYSDINLKFDSYLKNIDDLNLGDYRLLDVDNRCILPIDLWILFRVSSSDVIHSWTLFNNFLKIDAIRGILNTLNQIFPLVGVYYGQCSEICGANHRFIPVVLEITSFKSFKYWLI